jgi:hypothetical protein
LSGWRICSGSTRLMDAHPILKDSLKDIDVYDREMSELDAIARNTGLADRAAIGARQVGLVVEAKHIDRNASRAGAQANIGGRSAIWFPLVLAGPGLRVAQPRVVAARLIRWLIRLGIGRRARVSEISLEA